MPLIAAPEQLASRSDQLPTRLSSTDTSDLDAWVSRQLYCTRVTHRVKGRHSMIAASRGLRASLP